MFDTIMNVSIALCIDWPIQYSHGKVGRFLNRCLSVLSAC